MISRMDRHSSRCFNEVKGFAESVFRGANCCGFSWTYFLGEFSSALLLNFTVVCFFCERIIF